MNVIENGVVDGGYGEGVGGGGGHPNETGVGVAGIGAEGEDGEHPHKGATINNARMSLGALALISLLM